MSRPCLLVLLLPLTVFAQEETKDTKAFGVREVQVALESLPKEQRPPKRFALLVGVAKYEDQRIPALPHCENDVNGLVKLLTDPTLGMFPKENVVTLLDSHVTRTKVIEELDKLGRKAGPDDLVVVYFTGHGATDTRSRSYWVMHRTKVDSLRATALPENEVTDLLSDIKTSRLVVMIDACFSASTAKLPEGNKSLTDLKKLYPKFQGKGRVAITSSSGEELSVVINDEKHPGYGYSVFSWHVQEALQGQGDGDRDGVLTVTELWQHVQKTVPVTARKMGGKHAPQLKGQMGGKFLLAVDATRLTEKLKTAEELRQLKLSRVKKLKELALDEMLTLKLYSEGRRLMEQDPEKLTKLDQQILREYVNVIEGKLSPDKLPRALDLIRKRESFAESIGIKLVKIEPGEFWMGSSDADIERILKLWPTAKREYLEKEQPRHKVRITKPYWLSAHEITVGQFRTFVKDTGYKTEAEKDAEGGRVYNVEKKKWILDAKINWWNPGFHQTDNHPVTQVTWSDALAFCRWLSEKDGATYRLPTEAQWEYACRAGSTTLFSSGDEKNSLKSVGNTGDQSVRAGIKDWSHATESWRDGFIYTAPVGSFRPNRWGLYDMHGNVWEMCSHLQGSYKESPLDDPQGPEAAFWFLVVRGGSWSCDGSGCRSGKRAAVWVGGGYEPYDRHPALGFRVLRVQQPR